MKAGAETPATADPQLHGGATPSRPAMKAGAETPATELFSRWVGSRIHALQLRNRRSARIIVVQGLSLLPMQAFLVLASLRAYPLVPYSDNSQVRGSFGGLGCQGASGVRTVRCRS